MNSVRLTLGEAGVYYDYSVRSWITFTNDLYNEYSQDIRLKYIKDRLLYERREPTCEEVRILNEVVRDQYIANNVDPIYINKLTNNFICRNGVVALNGVIWDINNGLVPSSSVTTEYQTLLDRATFLTYTKPSSGQRVKQNTLMASIIAAGLLPDIDVMWVFATDGDSDFATLNWITPASNQCTKVNSPTFTPNQGFNGNDVDSYLNTNLATSQLVKATVSSVSFLIGIPTWPLTSGFQLGTAGDSIAFSLWNASAKLIDNGINFDIGETPPAGTWFADRNGTDINVYRNNSLYKNATLATGSVHSSPIYIDAMNEGPATNFNNALISVLIIAKHLDSTKQTALYNAVTTYLASI